MQHPNSLYSSALAAELDYIVRRWILPVNKAYRLIAYANNAINVVKPVDLQPRH